MPAMAFHTHIPQSPLSCFVDSFWYYEGPRPAHAKERVLPCAATQIVINLHEDALAIYEPRDQDRFQGFRGTLVSGARSEYCVIDTASQVSIMGVNFRPGGAFPFFDLPALELHNLHVPLDSLWGGRASELRERLLEAASPAIKFRVLDRCLNRRADRFPRRHSAVVYALEQFQCAPPVPKVSEVICQIGLSARRFIQVFSEQVGMPPKLFCRVHRFQELLRQLSAGGDVDWSDIACACGYFDQAHFIRDFRDFAGLNPTAYFSQRGTHHNHVPVEV